MLRRFGSFVGAGVEATDGPIGVIHDLYFDDASWTVRHIVVDTGGWLNGRHVLISPATMTGTDPTGQRFLTALRRQQVERSPEVDIEAPLSRREEAELAAYYGLPPYWAGPYRWGTDPHPAAALDPVRDTVEVTGEPILHSARSVEGYGIKASDGELGHVEDFLIDEESWAIRYLLVDPRNWWPGPHVLIAADWIGEVDWNAGTVSVHMSREKVQNAPEWRPEDRIDRDYERRLHGYYGRPGYWDQPPDRWMLWPPAA
jgi:hypothetical protein